MKDINDMPPQFTKEEWFTEVDETEGPDLPEMPILTVTVHDEDETNKFQYKVLHLSFFLLKYLLLSSRTILSIYSTISDVDRSSKVVVMALTNLPW